MMQEVQRQRRQLTLLGWLVVAGGLGIFMVWAALAPLDEGVVASGVVQTEAKRKPIQHPVTTVIRQVFVKEGQVVKAGAPLVQLDDAQPSAAYQSVRSQYLALKAQQDRLTAERLGLETVRFDGTLFGAEHKAAAAEFVQRETSLFATRRAALAADLSVLEQAVRSAVEQERALMAQLAGRRDQARLVEEQITSTRNLAREGFISRTKVLDDERVAADLASQIEEVSANLSRVRAQIIELRLRTDQRRRDFAREVEESATAVRRDLGPIQERMIAAQVELARTRILSPADGMVVGLAIQSVGAVVPEGATIMDIVPIREGLLIEARVSPDAIERVRPGQQADVRLTGFPDLPYLAIEGLVLSISADRLEEPNRPPYFLARIELTEDGRRRLGERRLQPGMSADVVIKTGERTMLHYLLKPLVRRLSAAMTEV